MPGVITSHSLREFTKTLNPWNNRHLTSIHAAEWIMMKMNETEVFKEYFLVDDLLFLLITSCSTYFDKVLHFYSPDSFWIPVVFWKDTHNKETPLITWTLKRKTDNCNTYLCTHLHWTESTYRAVVSLPKLSVEKEHFALEKNLLQAAVLLLQFKCVWIMSRLSSINLFPTLNDDETDVLRYNCSICSLK